MRRAQVPADMLPLPRPEGEVLRPLMGSGDQMPAAGLGTCCRATAYHDDSVYTLRPKPSTFTTLLPYTLNPQPSTLNPKP